jgi:hypothetical protein
VNLVRLGVQFAPVLAVVFGLCVLGGLAAIRFARRRARKTGFGVVRERAIYTARRWMLRTAMLALLAGASVWLWVVAVYNPEVLPTPVPTPTSTLIPSPTPRPPTATPTVASTPAHTLVPTATSTPDVLVTPDDRRSSTVSVLPAGTVEPGPDASVVEVVLAAGQAANEPVRPASRFPQGTKRVYAFMTFEGMAPGVPWSHVWYVEVGGQMQELWRETSSWPYAYATGRQWRYLNCRAGRYELQVYVGDQLQQTVSFLVEGG